MYVIFGRIAAAASVAKMPPAAYRLDGEGVGLRGKDVVAFVHKIVLHFGYFSVHAKERGGQSPETAKTFRWGHRQRRHSDRDRGNDGEEIRDIDNKDLEIET